MKKAIVASACLLLTTASPIFALNTIYDEDVTEATSTAYSASSSSVIATPSSRTTTTIATTKMPVSGTMENTIALLLVGTMCIFVGYRYSRG